MNLYVNVIAPAAYASPDAACLTRVFAKMVADEVNEYAYHAEARRHVARLPRGECEPLVLAAGGGASLRRVQYDDGDAPRDGGVLAQAAAAASEATLEDGEACARAGAIRRAEGLRTSLPT